MTELDLEAMSDEELLTLSLAVQEKIGHRSAIKNMDQQMDDLINTHNDAIGREEEQEWVQPTNAIDSYMLDWVVTWNEKIWINVVPYNVWEPGVYGWIEYVGPDPDNPDPEIPEWVAPTGSEDVYNTGDQVTFAGEVYESTIDANTWSPADYPAGWKVIET